MISWSHWHTEPFLLGGLLFFGWLYALAVGPARIRWLRDAEGCAPPFPQIPARWMAAAVVVFYLTVGSPLDALGENFLFSAHMIQHNLLMYVLPPLFLKGLPVWLVDSLLEHRGGARRLVAFFVHPIVAGILFTGIFSGWHIPSLYELALHDKLWHAVEHLTMFVGALLMWWPILSPSRVLPGISRGACLLYVFALMIAQIPVFGILVFAENVLYPTYAFAPRVIDLSPMEDQMLGGVIMKLANMIVSLAIMGTIFYQWAPGSRPLEQIPVAGDAACVRAQW